MGLDATSPLTGSCSARVGVCVVVGASRISHRTTALSGPRTASSITLPHNPCKRGGIAPWRVVRPFRSRDRVLVTLVKRYLITYQKPKRQVRVRTGPGGDGSRCGAVMLWLAVCRVCGRPVCVSHAAESGPGLHGPQKPPAEQAREKTKPKQTGGGAQSVMSSCSEDRPPAQFVAPRPAPESRRCKSRFFTSLCMYVLRMYVFFSLASGEKEQSLLGCLLRFGADLTQRVLAASCC